MRACMLRACLAHARALIRVYSRGERGGTKGEVRRKSALHAIEKGSRWPPTRECNPLESNSSFWFRSRDRDVSVRGNFWCDNFGTHRSCEILNI